MKWILLCSILLASVYSNKHALHMFQQNRYEFGRYTTWMKDNFSSLFKEEFISYNVFFVVGLICYFLLHGDYSEIIVICGAVLLFLLGFKKEKSKDYIKPLVYTNRVKRQVVFLYALDAILAYLLFVVWKAPIVIGLIFPVFAWVLIYPMAVLTAPLEKLVKNWYLNDAKRILKEHSDLIKVGITGSYGKTTTKNVMHAILSEQYQTLMTPSSFNTPMGITRTIREYLKPIDRVFVCEMGADHVGDITELMEFVHPSIGLVTSIGPQHLQTFGSLENIINEKMQMIECLPQDGLGVLNYDNEYIRNYKIKNSVQTISYGIESEDADYRAVDIQYSNKGMKFTVIHQEERIQFETKLLGELNILNILSAIVVARYLNIPWTSIVRGVKNMKQVEHRLERKVINGYTFIDDAFNSNPSGSKMALDVLSRMEGVRFIVTPGMIDLGPIQEETNYEFGRYMKGRADAVLLVGRKQTEPILRGLKDAGFAMDHVKVVDTVKEAFATIYRTATPDDIILLENDLPDAFSN